MKQKPYKKLVVWQNAYLFSLAIYKSTEEFPDHEKFGLISQLRRAAVSVAANIVEGQAKASRKDFLRYLYISRGSLTECEFFLELAKDLNYIDETEYHMLESLRGQAGYLLHKFMISLKKHL